MVTIRLIVLAHAANGAGWLIAGSTPLLVQTLASPLRSRLATEGPPDLAVRGLEPGRGPRVGIEPQRESFTEDSPFAARVGAAESPHDQPQDEGEAAERQVGY